MGRTTVIIIIYGLAAAGANLLGGLFVSSRKLGQTTLRYLIALGAGFMLAAVFLKIVPETIEQWPGSPLVPMMWLLAGYLLIQFVEHTVAPHFHFGEETHEEAMLEHHAAMAGVSALMVHTFFDGVAIAAGFIVSPSVGLLIFMAVLLHKIPDGFTISSIIITSGYSKQSALAAATALGISTLLGFLAVHLLGGSVPYALPVSTGATLYVAATDLMPEVNHEKGIKMAIVVFAGMGLFLLLRTIAVH